MIELCYICVIKVLECCCKYVVNYVLGIKVVYEKFICSK